jgi:type IV pilus assembly protein PilM
MIWNPFKALSKNCIGVDIGTASIKVVELAKGKGKTLSNYGTLSSEYFSNREFQSREKGALSFNEDAIVQALGSILQEAGIKSKDAFFAIPDFVSFFTAFDLPPMTMQEVPEAIKYEAPRRIPLPLSDVTLDWQIVKGGPTTEGKTPLRVLLVTVPNEAIEKYQGIANNTGLRIKALEAEVFAMSRALIKYQDKANVVCLIDVGERSTTINIVSQGVLKLSYSFDISAGSFTKALSEALSIDKRKAEIIKRAYGISNKKPTIREILLPFAESILKKTKNIFDELYMEDKERARKVILSGGGVDMPGFLDHFSRGLDLPVEIANPFIDIFYPPTLQDTLQKLGPKFTISVGMALRGLERSL